MSHLVIVIWLPAAKMLCFKLLQKHEGRGLANLYSLHHLMRGCGYPRHALHEVQRYALCY